MTTEGKFWEREDGGRVRCRLCHHQCRILSGSFGICGVRKNEGGRLVLPYYGKISSVAVDPIEKKPLYHFRPGKAVFSIGFTGCNLKCPFCQNWTISQDPDAPTEVLLPPDAVSAARKARCSMIAYTYSEPLIHTEYLLDCMQLARKAGLENILVTNGHVMEEPARKILELTDAANVDLKTWNSEWYRSELNGDLSTVKRFLEIAAKATHLEVTTLVIPGKNDSEREILSIAEFVSSLSADIPLHLSAYHPMFKYEEPPTRPSALESLAKIARTSLRYVYVGNVIGTSDTLCATCGAVLVAREGYHVSIRDLTRAQDGTGVCDVCGAFVPILPP